MAYRILITGCGRAGTQFTARLLGLAGVPCTHEKVYLHDLDPSDPGKGKVEDRWVGEAEASWMAVPFLAWHGIPEGTVVWHQLRDPLKVLRCWLSHGILDDEHKQQPPPVECRDFVRRFLPEAAQGSPLARCVAYVRGWTDALLRFEEDHRCHSYRVEKLTPKLLRKLLLVAGHDRNMNQVETAMGMVGGPVGSCGEAHLPTPTVKEVCEVPGGCELLATYAKFGYDFGGR